MGRGGARRSEARDGPERRCLASGESRPATGLIRFVLSPDGAVTPDVAEKLPGRGVWVAADRAALQKAIAKKLFSRGFRTQALAPDDLIDHVERLLAKRAIEALALCRKAGGAVAGFEKTREAAERASTDAAWDQEEDWPDETAEEESSPARLLPDRAPTPDHAFHLVQARDGSPDGRRKLSRLAPPDAVLTPLDKAELGLAFGRPYVIHAGLIGGGATKRAVRELKRLQGVRGAEPPSGSNGSTLCDPGRAPHGRREAGPSEADASQEGSARRFLENAAGPATGRPGDKKATE